MFKDYYEKRTEDFLFGLRKKKMSYATAVKDLKILAEKAHVPFCGTHSFRRGATTAALEDGANIDQVQRRGRWKCQDSMNSYISDSALTQGGLTKIP